MLALFYDDTHLALREAAQRFVEREIRPHVAEWERAGWFPESLARAAGDAGLLGVGYPEELGGSGGDVFHRLIVTEALVRGGSGGVAAGLGSHAISLPLIVEHGGAGAEPSRAPRRREPPGALALAPGRALPTRGQRAADPLRLPGLGRAG